MAVFIEYPLLAAVIGGLLLGLGRWMRRRTAAGAGILWLVYAAYETGMRQRWLCSGECNIRVDLLVIYPLLLLALVAAVVSLLRRRVVPILLLSLGSTVAMAQARTDRPGQRPRLPLGTAARHARHLPPRRRGRGAALGDGIEPVPDDQPHRRRALDHGARGKRAGRRAMRARLSGAPP